MAVTAGGGWLFNAAARVSGGRMWGWVSMPPCPECNSESTEECDGSHGLVLRCPVCDLVWALADTERLTMEREERERE